MRTFSRVFNVISGLIATVLIWIMGINERGIVLGLILSAMTLFLVFVFESILSKVGDKDFKDCAKTILVGWIAILILLSFTCYDSFKSAEIYNKAVGAYNNGRYEEALDGFIELDGKYDTDDYLETVVRLKGTDVEVVK
jgi:energy-coupling factor transporter transmembrane protein EcfT